MSRCHLAVDIGASSGRHIVGTVNDGKMELTEVYRFENGLTEKNGHLTWDIVSLRENVIAGLRAAKDAGFEPESIGIDTWAVDFVLLDKEGQIIGDTVAYRDSRTDGIREELDRMAASGEGGVSFAEQYAHTGIQFQKFNTCYQLAALKKEHPEQLEAAEDFLMVPDYLAYSLTGVKANEYTNASTTALVNAVTKDWDDELIEKYGLPRGIFEEIKVPGTELGSLTPEIRERVGYDAKVILPASHDTGSAYLAVPARDDKAVFLSSGTWSLMGVENREAITTPDSAAENFTNEGGYEYRFRYLKNIMGLWMIQSVRRELGKITGTRPSFPELIVEANKYCDFKGEVDADDGRFLAPESMIAEVAKAVEENGTGGKDAAAAKDPVTGTSLTVGETMQVIYNSLSADYARTVASLEKLTGKQFTAVNIVGGGSQDGFLDQRTANATGLTVFAGPTEGTALGNLIVQWIASGEYKDLQEARDAIKKSFEIKEFTPQS